MKYFLKQSPQFITAIVLFILITVWWIVLYLSGLRENFHNYLFAAVYGVMALLGGVWGLYIAQKWGGWGSVLGRATVLLSCGLLAAEFGQLVFSYYNIFKHIEIPYPSLADIGFFANIPLYTFGMLLLARVAGAQFTSQKLSHKLQIVLLPLFMLTASYLVFLQKYEFDWSQPLKIFLDFAYPLGQAIYVSVALLTYSLSTNILGGIMRRRILFLVVAFVAQYVADYNFLFQSNAGTWYNGGYGDYLYFFAYFLMTIGLIELETAYDSVRLNTKQ